LYQTLIRSLLRPGLVALLMASLSCTAVEEKRIRELLNEKGFGTRAQGVATLEDYVTGGDAVVFFLEPGLALEPGFEQLALLAQPQSLAIDGTIHIPYVGSLMVLGLTERELQSLVQEQLQTISKWEIRLTARIVDKGKAFYAFGEVISKGRLDLVKADMTVLEAVSIVGTTKLANVGRIQVIRPDAQNPLVVEVNLREMVQTGNTVYNILLQDNDILYVPPTFWGMLTRFLEKLLEPLAILTRTLWGISSIRYSYDTIFGGGGGGFNNGRYFGF